MGEVFDAAAVGSGTSPVSTVSGTALLEYKINQSGTGITATDNSGINIQVTLAPGSVLHLHI